MIMIMHFSIDGGSQSFETRIKQFRVIIGDVLQYQIEQRVVDEKATVVRNETFQLQNNARLGGKI